MTNLTHFSIGCIIAFAYSGSIIERRFPLRLMFVAGAVANLPDLDFIGGLAAHRLVTHGILFEVLTGLAAVWLVAPRERIFSPKWIGVASVLVLAGLSHSFADGMNPSAGPAYFAPFWNQHLKWGLDMVPDVFLTSQTVVDSSWWSGLWAALRAESVVILFLLIPVLAATERRALRRRKLAIIGWGRRPVTA